MGIITVSMPGTRKNGKRTPVLVGQHTPKQHSSFYLILLRYLTAMSSRQPYWKIRYWQGKRFSVVRKLCVAIQETRKEDDRFRRRLAAFYFVLTLRFKEKILRYCHKE